MNTPGFVRPWELTHEDRMQISEMTGKIMGWTLEGRSIGYMAEKLHMYPWQVEHNIDEMIYTLRKQVGVRRFLRNLLWK